MRDRVLIVDDEIGVRKQIAWGLREHFDVAEADTVETAIDTFSSFHPAVVTLDVRLTGPRCSAGLDLLRRMLVGDPDAKIIMVTADANDGSATRAIELGAWDYYTKPIVAAELLSVATRAARVRRLAGVARRRHDALVSPTDFATWIGSSPSAGRVERLIRTLADAREPVLVTGEPGTGRELAARALGELGRAKGEFVEVSCTGSLPRPDEIAADATIFLDDVTALETEILELLPSWIAAVSSRARVVASAPSHLTAPSRERSFPERTYHYLAALTAVLPPLREHAEDVPEIARRLLQLIAGTFATRATRLADDAAVALSRHQWPGNFRELEKRVLGAALVAEGETLTEADLWPELPTGARAGLKNSLAELERSLVERSLREHRGNVSRAARALEISRPTLHALIRKHEIDPELYRQASPS